MFHVVDYDRARKFVLAPMLYWPAWENAYDVVDLVCRRLTGSGVGRGPEIYRRFHAPGALGVYGRVDGRQRVPAWAGDAPAASWYRVCRLDRHRHGRHGDRWHGAAGRACRCVAS